MQPIEIIVIAAAILIVSSVIGVYIYKKIKNLPTGECSCCSKNNKNMFNKLKKELKEEFNK